MVVNKIWKSFKIVCLVRTSLDKNLFVIHIDKLLLKHFYHKIFFKINQIKCHCTHNLWRMRNDLSGLLSSCVCGWIGVQALYWERRISYFCEGWMPNITLKLSAVGFERCPSLGSLHSHCLGNLPSLASHAQSLSWLYWILHLLGPILYNNLSLWLV